MIIKPLSYNKEGRSEESKKFINWMDNYRSAHKLSIDEITKVLGVSRRTIFYWRRDPSKIHKEHLESMSKIFECKNKSIEDLCKDFRNVTNNRKCYKKRNNCDKK